jgi:ABC-type phosphonate transport system ATPase subunit
LTCPPTIPILFPVMNNKNKVVAVVGDAGYDGTQLIGVFSSEEEAKKSVLEMDNDDFKVFDQFAFAELELNQAYRGWGWIFDKDENGNRLAKFYEISIRGDLVEC